MAGNGDMKAHEATYGSMIGLLKYGGIAVLIIAALVIWILAR